MTTGSTGCTADPTSLIVDPSHVVSGAVELDDVRFGARLDLDGIQQVDAVIVLVHVAAAHLDDVDVVHIDQASRARLQPGLLVQLASHRHVRGLAVIDAAARQPPPAGRIAHGRDAGQKDALPSVTTAYAPSRCVRVGSGTVPPQVSFSSDL